MNLADPLPPSTILSALQEVLGNDDVGAPGEGDARRHLPDQRGVAKQRQQVLVPVLEMAGDDRAKPVEAGFGGGMGHDQSIEAVPECHQHLCQGGIGRRLMVLGLHKHSFFGRRREVEARASERQVAASCRPDEGLSTVETIGRGSSYR